MIHVRDYAPLLEEAIAEARAEGFVVEAHELERKANGVYTTSSELLGEHGLAIRTFLKATGSRLPRSIRSKLETCLDRMESVREFSDKEVLAARGFCLAVGGLLAFVGVRLATGEASSVPPAVAWTAAGIGAVIALFGLAAPRRQCVRAASLVLQLIA